MRGLSLRKVSWKAGFSLSARRRTQARTETYSVAFGEGLLEHNRPPFVLLKDGALVLHALGPGCHPQHTYGSREEEREGQKLQCILHFPTSTSLPQDCLFLRPSPMTLCQTAVSLHPKLGLLLSISLLLTQAAIIWVGEGATTEKKKKNAFATLACGQVDGTFS